MPNIYPDDGDATLRVDNKSSWTDARGASVADEFGGTGHAAAAKYASAVKIAAGSGTNYDCYRYFAVFDTSGISVKPDSATFKLYGFTNTNSQIIVVKVNAGATGDIGVDFALEDFDQSTTTAYSAEYSGAWSTTAYNEITLNDSALQDMADLDVLKIAVIDHDFDYSNSAPPNSITRVTGFYFINEAGVDKDPVISYVEGTSGAPTFDETIPDSLVDDDFTINTFAQNTLSVQYSRVGSAQVPFILGGPSPLRIRGSTNAQVIKAGDKKN
jgi:hypothetical protein